MELKLRDVTGAESERPPKTLPPASQRRFETRAVSLDEQDSDPPDPTRHGVHQLKARQAGRRRASDALASLTGLQQRIQARMAPSHVLSAEQGAEDDENGSALQLKSGPHTDAGDVGPSDRLATLGERSSNTRNTRNTSSSGGMPLQDSVRDKMESAFGADFSGVRVHADGKADALGAQAFTQGENIHFGQGQYAPENHSGQELLGHELTHVLQQRAGRVATTTQARGLDLNDDAGLEQEADVLGAQAAQGSRVQVPGHSRQETLAMPVVQAKFLPGMGPIQLKGKPVTPAVLQKVEALLRERAASAPNGDISKFLKTVQDESQRQQAYGELISADCVYDNGGTGGPYVPRIHPNHMKRLREILRGYTKSALENQKGAADPKLADKKNDESHDAVIDEKSQNESKEEDKKADEQKSSLNDQTDLKQDEKDKVVAEDANSQKDEEKTEEKKGDAQNTIADTQKEQKADDNLKSVEEKKADDQKKEETPTEAEEEEALETNLKNPDPGTLLENFEGHKTEHKFESKAGEDESEEEEPKEAIAKDIKGKIGLFEAGFSKTALKGKYQKEGAFGSVEAEGRLMGIEGKAEGAIEATPEGVAAKLGLTGNVTFAAGKIILKPPVLTLNIMGEKLYFEAGVALEAAVIASARAEASLAAGITKGGKKADAPAEDPNAPAGSSGVGVKQEGNGVKLEFEGGLDAFAGVKGAATVFGKLQWSPKAFSNGPKKGDGAPIDLSDGNKLDVLGASFGAEGWAGAAAVCQIKASLLPSLSFSANVGLAVGIGGGLKLEIELNLVNGALLAFTLAARGLQAMFDAVGATYVAKVIDRFITSLYEDDMARAIVAKGLHKDLTVAQRSTLINNMLDGVCGDEDEQAIIQIFKDAAGPDANAILLGIPDGTSRLYDKVDGEELGELFATLFEKKVQGLQITDKIARAIVLHDQHKNLVPQDGARLINALLEGWTGGADEQAIIKILSIHDASGIRTVLNEVKGGEQRIFSSVDGDNYKALKTLLKVKGVPQQQSEEDQKSGKQADPLVNEELTDDGAQVLAELAPEAIPDEKIEEVIDAMANSSIVGDGEELAILTLLGKLSADRFKAVVSGERLTRLHKVIDGAEYTQFKALLLKHGMLKDEDRDDATIRAWVALGQEKADADEGKELTEEEKNAKEAKSLDEKDKMLKSLLSGFTGDDDELAILGILQQASDSELSSLLNTHGSALQKSVDGEEYDQLLALLLERKQLNAPFTLTDDAAVYFITQGKHSASDEQQVRQLLEAILDKRVGGTHEQALLTLLEAHADKLKTFHAEFHERLEGSIDGDNYTRYLQLLYRNGLTKGQKVSGKLAEAINREEQARKEGGTEAGAKTGEQDKLTDEQKKEQSDNKVTLIQDLVASMRVDGEKETALLHLLESCDDAEWGVLNGKPGQELFHKAIDGENNDLFHALLFRKGWGLPKVDDDVARQVVNHPTFEALSFAEGKLQTLMDELLSGAVGDDDEAALLKLLDHAGKRGLWSKLVTPEKNTQLKKAIDGAEYQQLLKLMATYGDKSATVSDDDEARANTAGEVERIKQQREAAAQKGKDGNAQGKDGAQAQSDGSQEKKEAEKGEEEKIDVSKRVELINAMLEGFTGDEDEQAILALLEVSELAEVEAILTEVGGAKLRKAIDGEEYDRFVALLFTKGVSLPRDGIILNDDAARLVVSQGGLESLTEAQAAALINALLQGATGDDDEQAIIAVLKAHQDKVETICNKVEGGLNAIDSAIDGRDSKEFRGLLWVNGKLSKLSANPKLNDDIAAGIVRQGLHTSLSPKQVLELITALTAVFVVDGEDEETIVTILQENPSSASAGIDVDAVSKRISGDNLLEFWSAAAKQGLIKDATQYKQLKQDAIRVILRDGYENKLSMESMLKVILRDFNGAASSHLISMLYERAPDDVKAALGEELKKNLIPKIKPYVDHELFQKLSA